MILRRFKDISVVVVVAVIVVGGVTLALMSSSSMRWFVRERDTLSFTVEVEGFKREFDPLNSSIWNDTAPPYSHLNISSFTIEVLELPTLTSVYTADSFASHVIEHTKSSLTSPIVLVNGTELPDEDYLFLNVLVSRSILPIGGWIRLDEFYPNEPDFMYQCDTYLSSSDVSTFTIGHRYYNIDSGRGWNAAVNKSTGVPIQATLWENEILGNTWISYSVTVILTST